MPLLESFLVDHTIMASPAVRLAKTMQSPSQDIITVYDLRFCQPNKEILTECGTHTLEHLFAGFMRQHLDDDKLKIIDISPMGCRTGFYMSTIGQAAENDVIKAWSAAMQDVLNVKRQEDIPELNIYQCGSAHLHSLDQAKEIAQTVLDKGIGINDNEALKLDEAKLASIKAGKI